MKEKTETQFYDISVLPSGYSSVKICLYLLQCMSNIIPSKTPGCLPILIGIYWVDRGTNRLYECAFPSTSQSVGHAKYEFWLCAGGAHMIHWSYVGKLLLLCYCYTKTILNFFISYYWSILKHPLNHKIMVTEVTKQHTNKYQIGGFGSWFNFGFKQKLIHHNVEYSYYILYN